MDIQGGERIALIGALETIKRLRPVLFVEIVDYSDDAEETKLFLISLGYKLFGLDKDGNLVDLKNPNLFISWDIVCIPNTVS